MKSYELAKALRLLATIIESGDNVPIQKLSLTPPKSKQGELALNLSTLSDLSRVDKTQWLNFISELGFDIPVRPRDASRDILGKLLNYLEAHESAREKLQKAVSVSESEASPELMKALSSLLRNAR